MKSLGDYVPNPLMLLTVSDLEDITGLSRAILLRLTEAGELPKPVRVGHRYALWFETDIVKWLREKREQSVTADRESQSCSPDFCPSTT